MSRRSIGRQTPGSRGEAGRPEKQGVLALQQVAGNRAVGQMLARKQAAATTVQIGKLKIAVAGGNIADWAAKDVPDSLDVTSEKGRHSAELERMATARTKIPVLTLTTPLTNAEGEHLDLGSLAIDIKNARIKGYTVDGTTESWRVVDFDGVHRTKTSRKVA